MKHMLSPLWLMTLAAAAGDDAGAARLLAENPPSSPPGGGLGDEDWEDFDNEDFEDPKSSPGSGVQIDDLLIKASDAPEVASEKLNRMSVQMKAALKAADGKHTALERMVNDFGHNLRAVQERLAVMSSSPPPGGPESELRSFVEKRKIGGKEQEVVRWVGGADSDGIYRSGLLDDDIGEYGDWHTELRDLMESRSLARLVVRSDDPSNQTAAGRTPKLDRLVEEHLQRAPAPLQRIFSGGSGAGGDWQQVTVLPMIASELRRPLQVEALFETVEMPSKTVSMPFDAGVARPYRKGTPASNNVANLPASDSSTASRTLTSDSLAVQIMLFDDADEDSVIATRAFLSRKVVDGLRYGFEDCVLNGDTGTHQDSLSGWNPRSIYNTGDSAFGGADDHRRSFVGLRAAAFDASSSRDASGDSAFSTGTLKSARLGLSAPHGVDGDLVYLASIEHYLLHILTDSNTLTVDKMGQMAAILTGQVASVLGVRIVVTEFLTSDLAATGLYTSSGSRTGGLLFNRKRFVVGNRRGVLLEAAKDIRNGVHYLVATRRGTWKPVDASTHKAVHFSYNISSS